MKRLYISILIICGFCFTSAAQNTITKDFQPVCDSLDLLIKQKRNVKGQLKIKNVMKRGDLLDIYFTESLGDYPWREGEPEWFRKQLRNLFPEKYRKYKLGRVFSSRVPLERLVTSELGFDGTPSGDAFRTEEPSDDYPLVKRVDSPAFSKGMDGRTIALWQSHGRYFDQGTGSWIWQRPPLFQTVEDMFTQGFVLPYLVPMLENAGAYVMLPRERDTQIHEVIVDFDVTDETYGTSEYTETGKWKDAGTGFAALKPVYTGIETPFTMGSARKTEAGTADDRKGAGAVWCPDIPERGEYAVYISYKSLPESASAVEYTVSHMGGESRYIVNQKIGGGTWVYLGTFEFDKGNEGYVSISGKTPKGYEHKKGKVITADAVKFGGGMGNIARARKGSGNAPEVSGMPRFAEGARYWLQWAGTDPSIFSQNEQRDDYRDDFMSRGDWVEWISRGSRMNPGKKGGRGVPVDLSMGFHSDAGSTPNDSIVGTLAIYTLRSEGSEKLQGGESRMTSREFADLVQTQIVNDLVKEFDPEWSRRCVWDRSYRESRTPSSPAMLLELLSHQNFADMKYGHDPSFRFTVSRAVYKGMLKYLSNRYGVPYVVQPLPVRNMGVRFSDDGKALISWTETEDPIEPTAKASGFILQTRIGDGGFDTGKIIKAKRSAEGLYTFTADLKPGKIYSFRISAMNEGGVSFPSETVSIGIPLSGMTSRKVLIVNNFDRISGPAFIDTPVYAGFDNRLDSGVPYIKDITYIGDMYEFRRDSEFVTNDNPGFGASYDDYAGKTVAGNTFDYPAIHGKAMIEAGYPFYSCSNDSFCSDTSFVSTAWAADIICGKQVSVTVGSSNESRFDVFPYEMQTAIKAFTSKGGNILISGANIATDVWDKVFPVDKDSKVMEDTKKFVRETLGYKWVRNHAGRNGIVNIVESTRMGTEESGEAMAWYNEINSDSYCVETPDGIAPVSSRTGSTFMRYDGTDISAAVCFEGPGYRCVSIGFPIETIKEEKDINSIISLTLDFFNK